MAFIKRATVVCFKWFFGLFMPEARHFSGDARIHIHNQFACFHQHVWICAYLAYTKGVELAWINQKASEIVHQWIFGSEREGSFCQNVPMFSCFSWFFGLFTPVTTDSYSQPFCLLPSKKNWRVNRCSIGLCQRHGVGMNKSEIIWNGAPMNLWLKSRPHLQRPD